MVNSMQKQVTKKKRTFVDLVDTGFAKEEDLLKLRNILIDKNIVILGNKNTGLPLLFAIICDVLREELKCTPFVIYETDYEYRLKVSKAASKPFDRVAFMQVISNNTVCDALTVLQKNPVIMCVEEDNYITEDFLNKFDYVIDMSYGVTAKMIGIHDAKTYKM